MTALSSSVRAPQARDSTTYAYSRDLDAACSTATAWSSVRDLLGRPGKHVSVLFPWRDVAEFTAQAEAAAQ